MAELEKQTLTALHDKDISAALESLGVLSDFMAGKVRCKYCREILTIETLHAYFPETGTIQFVCSSKSCVERFLAAVRDGAIRLSRG